MKAFAIKVGHSWAGETCKFRWLADSLHHRPGYRLSRNQADRLLFPSEDKAKEHLKLAQARKWESPIKSWEIIEVEI